MAQDTVTDACISLSKLEDLPDQLGDDPYGVIIFDDIRPFIVPLYSEDARLQFMDCVFNFLGLSMNSFAGSNGYQPTAVAPASVQKHSRVTSLYNPYFHDSLLLSLDMGTRSTQDPNGGLKRFFPQFESKDGLVERILKEIEQEQQFRESEERDWSCVWNLPLHLYPQGADVIFGGLSGGSDSERENQHSWAKLGGHEEIQMSNRIFVRYDLA